MFSYIKEKFISLTSCKTRLDKTLDIRHIHIAIAIRKNLVNELGALVFLGDNGAFAGILLFLLDLRRLADDGLFLRALSLRQHGHAAAGAAVGGLLFIERVDNLAKADVDFVQSVAAGGVGEEAPLYGRADLGIRLSELLLG